VKESSPDNLTILQIIEKYIDIEILNSDIILIIDKSKIKKVEIIIYF
jgi:hypothetical protein